MTGVIPVGVTIAQAAAEALIGPIIVRQRNIGGFVADVTIRETHDDELRITENPVEQGAAVTDHSFKEPARLKVDVGYSNSGIAAGGDPNYVQSIYQQFLALQASRQPFDVITGKRSYTSMLIQRLHTITDEKTENALFLEVDMREIIIVQTQTVSVPPASSMSNPAANSPTQNLGTNQLAPASTYNETGSPLQSNVG